MNDHPRLTAAWKADVAEDFVEGDDPVVFEAETFRRSAGKLFPLPGRRAGVKDLNRRENLGALASKLVSTGL